jgi:hypothetical protein
MKGWTAAARIDGMRSFGGDLEHEFAGGSGARRSDSRESGNVFDIARGIREALLDEWLRAELIRRGRAQAARFSRKRQLAPCSRFIWTAQAASYYKP